MCSIRDRTLYIVQLFEGKSHSIREKGSKVSTLSAPRHAFTVHGPYCLNMYDYYELAAASAAAGMT